MKTPTADHATPASFKCRGQNAEVFLFATPASF